MKFKKDISTIGEQCTGCGACSAICPLGCIQMKVDAEGFRMPEIDQMTQYSMIRLEYWQQQVTMKKDASGVHLGEYSMKLRDM